MRVPTIEINFDLEVPKSRWLLLFQRVRLGFALIQQASPYSEQVLRRILTYIAHIPLLSLFMYNIYYKRLYRGVDIFLFLCVLGLTERFKAFLQ